MEGVIILKKLTALVLALALSVSYSAMAQAVPSKTIADLTRFEVTAENQPGDPDIFFLPLNEAAGEELPEYQKHLDICQMEIEKLAASESIERYFAKVTDSAAEPVDLRALLGIEKNAALNVFEFCPAIAGGFQEECGKVTVSMLFSTPYEEGEKVLVLIGIVTELEDGTYSVDWQAFEGIGQEALEEREETCGCVRVELTPEIVLAIQDGIALLAVVSR